MSKKKLVIGSIGLVIGTIICTILVQVFLLKGVFISKSLYEKYKKYDKLVALEQIVEQDYYKDVNEEDLIVGAEKGLIESLEDPYSQYYTKEEFTLLKEQTQGSFVGIGIYMKEGDNESVVIQSVIENYPAEKSGLKAGDTILKVDGENVNYSTAASKIKGKAGTSVVLTIQRNGKQSEVTVKREEIVVESVKYEVKENNIGYVQITSFDKNTYKEFKTAVTALQKKNVKSLIIDLRDNPGGLLDVCVDIADYLLGEGTIVYTKDNSGNTQYYKSDASKVDLPIVVLINENSASASEILTAAIVDNKAGIAVGTTSYGKGLVQSVREFKDGTGYKLTTAQYYTPNGDYINKQGIKPNIVEKNKEKQLDRAIEYIKNKNEKETT